MKSQSVAFHGNGARGRKVLKGFRFGALAFFAFSFVVSVSFTWFAVGLFQESERVMGVAIVKYNAGNVQSVLYALARLGVEANLTDDPAILQSADKVIFPGVGEASSAMRYLRERGLDNVLTSLTQPFLGICLGMQLMANHSEEGDTACLGVFDHEVKLFPASVGKVPHMGWNLLVEQEGPLLQNLPADPYVYFVHSYYVEPGESTIATCDYGMPFSAVMQKENYYATQFHPEKSGVVGAKILENFLAI